MNIQGILSYNDKNFEKNDTIDKPISYYKYLYDTDNIDIKLRELNFKLLTSFENLLAFNFDFVVDNIINAYSISKPRHLLFLTPEQEWNKIIYYYYKNIFAQKENKTKETWHIYKEHNNILKEIREYYPDFYKNEKEKISDKNYQIIFSIFIKLHSLINNVINSNDIISETTFKDFFNKYNYKLSEIQYKISNIIDTREYNEANLLKLKFNNSELQKFIDIALKKYILLDESDNESVKLKKLIEVCSNIINYNNKKIMVLDEGTIKRYRLLPNK